MSITTRIRPQTAWPQLQTEQGVFDAHSFQRDDGFRSLCFVRPGRELKPQEAFGGTTRITYRHAAGRGVLLGMYLTGELTGSGITPDLLRYFIDSIEPTEGVPFVGTGKIHKPVVALSLKNAGLQPVSERCIAEILPRAASDNSQIPKITIVASDLPAQEMVSGSGPNTFYEIVDPAEVRFSYPINDPNKTVALHTQYIPEGSS